MGTKIININSENLTAEIMTLFYIYGQGRTPTSEEMLDDKWIGRDKSEVTLNITNYDKYMKEGAGRFSSASRITLIQNFFNSNNGEKGEYSLTEALNTFGGKSTQVLQHLYYSKALLI